MNTNNKKNTSNKKNKRTIAKMRKIVGKKYAKIETEYKTWRDTTEEGIARRERTRLLRRETDGVRKISNNYEWRCDPKKQLENVDGEIFDDPLKIYIHPIMLQQQCHCNSQWLSERHPEYEWVLGYNLSTCDCGNRINAEVHSVNKINGEYVDFTADYGNAKSKWFLPLKEQKYNHVLTSVTAMEQLYQGQRGQVMEHWHKVHGNCTCKFKSILLPDHGEYQNMKRMFKFLDQVRIEYI